MFRCYMVYSKYQRTVLNVFECAGCTPAIRLDLFARTCALNSLPVALCIRKARTTIVASETSQLPQDEQYHFLPHASIHDPSCCPPAMDIVQYVVMLAVIFFLVDALSAFVFRHQVSGRNLTDCSFQQDGFPGVSKNIFCRLAVVCAYYVQRMALDPLLLQSSFFFSKWTKRAFHLLRS